MRSGNPMISVIMPVYNCARYVAEAIESIVRQRYDNWELLICDDGSTDDSKLVINRYVQLDCRIRFYQNEKNRGAAYVKNLLIGKSKGDYIALMDADDVSHQNRLAEQLEFLRSRQLDACGTDHCTIDTDGNLIAWHRNSYTYEQVLWSAFNHLCFCNASLLIKRECMLAIRCYDQRLQTEAEDVEMLFRFIHAGYRIETLDRCYYKYRQHDQNVSKRHSKQQKNNSFTATKHLIEKTMECECTDDFVNFVKFYHRPDFRLTGDCAAMFGTFSLLIAAIETKVLGRKINDKLVRLDIAVKMVFLSLNHGRKDRFEMTSLFLRAVRFFPAVVTLLLKNKCKTLFRMSAHQGKSFGLDIRKADGTMI